MMEAIIVFFCLGLIIGVVSGYAIGFYSTKNENKIHQDMILKDDLLEWAKEHKCVIETHGDERDAYLRGEYSILNSLIDKLNSM